MGKRVRFGLIGFSLSLGVASAVCVARNKRLLPSLSLSPRKASFASAGRWRFSAHVPSPPRTFILFGSERTRKQAEKKSPGRALTKRRRRKTFVGLSSSLSEGARRIERSVRVKMPSQPVRVYFSQAQQLRAEHE